MRNSTSQTQLKGFLVDGMLGRLARWLRILGYDTLFESSAGDWELVRRARAENRLLLTRDRQLAARRGVSALLIESDELAAQLRQVVAAVGPSADGAFTRCPVCNARLSPMRRRAARERVPLHVYNTHREFRFCSGCDRVYWRGTHWARMKEFLDDGQDLTLTGDQSIMVETS